MHFLRLMLRGGVPGESVEITDTSHSYSLHSHTIWQYYGGTVGLSINLFRTYYMSLISQRLADLQHSGALPVCIAKAVELATSLAYQPRASKDDSGLSGRNSIVELIWMSGWEE